MAERIGAANPRVLVWARERAGLGRDQVAAALGKAEDVIASWEAGEEFPTYGQLEKLAYEVYKRPLAIFFFPAPPDEKDPRTEFRLLPDFELESLEPDTLFAARQARAFQESLRELSGGTNPAAPMLLRQVNARTQPSVEALCASVRDVLGVSLAAQKTWGSLERALKNWREAIEARGVYVFKRSLKQEAISGFCLYDAEFPLIFINNSTSDSRQIFTLFHELCHLLYSTSGVTKEGPSYLGALPAADRRTEVVCNRFASQFLVPDNDFKPRIRGLSGTDEEVETLASLYSVSREVVLRRLMDHGVVDQSDYERRVAAWNRQWQDARGRRSGGNYYATQATYISRGFAQLAFARYYEGRCSLQELAGHLGVKAKNVERLEAQMFRE